MIEATLCFIVDETKRAILLGRKKRGFGQGKLNGLGGKIQPGEGLRDAMVREVFEESGVRLRPDALQDAGTITFWFPFESAFNHHVHVFVVTEWDGEPTESAEMAPAWFALDAIPYGRMWADDAHWMPIVLAGNRIEATFTFAEDNESLTSWEIREVIDR